MVHLEKQIQLSVPVHQLWPLISDTERINRVTGLPPVRYRAEKNPAGPAKIFGESQWGPFKMAWQEHPFEWVQEDHFFARRCFTQGPLKEIRPGVWLSPQNGATGIRISLDFEARNAMGTWISRHILAPAVFRKFENVFRDMENYLKKENVPNPFAKKGPRSEVDKKRLKALAERLKQRDIPRGLVDLLQAHMQYATDVDVAAMRPFVLADCWKKDRIDVLKMFLHATKEGLVDLSWEVLCPHCRKPTVRAKSLASMCCQFHCEACQIQYDASFDQSVEARFTPHPSVRNVPRMEFCAGGPGNTPHVLARVLVGAGERRQFSLRAECRPLVVRSPQVSTMARVLVREAGKPSCVIRLQDGRMQPAESEICSGMASFEIENNSVEEQWFIVERESWDIAVATAAQVTSLQEFRDMFSSEVLAPGHEIAVRSMTFMFTDLAGSTATYHDLGDAKAYSIVREHFVVLKDAIAENEGAVVKTIGDAVMAVFTSPEKGVLAAIAMQHGIRDWNAKRANEKSITLKIGLHEGAAIAVNADDILDYFGTSVNLAARIESLSTGGDIVLSENVMQAVADSVLLKDRVGTRERLETRVKGFPQPIRAWRIWPRDTRNGMDTTGAIYKEEGKKNAHGSAFDLL